MSKNNKVSNNKPNPTITWFKRRYESMFGSPRETKQVKMAKTAVLGAIEQSYGIYQIPSFREQVNVFWNDPLIKEAITMFAEQVIATGFFLDSNPKYILKINGKTAKDVIEEWCDDNDIDIKLLEIAIELKAFGNSMWRITNLGFVKVPVEALWHAVRIDPEVPLQERYDMQLQPIYGGVILPYGEFIHFRVGVTGYHAPFGQGVIYGLLAKPVDSVGNVSPSLYDIRLSMRSSLHEGFRKFSFGNVWIGMPHLSNEDFETQGIADKVSKMSSTGNRVVTNSDIKVELEVPERTQSYDAFLKVMQDEFLMGLAEPSLKLGLEQGFTKATSVTAAEANKFKISTMRRIIKEHFEDLFKLILDKQGYDGKEAKVIMNFGPEEKAEYAVKDIFDAVKTGIILKNEARKLLSEYHKWDIEGDIKDGDIPLLAPVSLLPTRAHPSPEGTVPEAETPATLKQEEQTKEGNNQ